MHALHLGSPAKILCQTKGILGSLDYVLQLEQGSEVFSGQHQVSYETLRESFVLVLREKPVVPCMTDTPSPSKFVVSYKEQAIQHILAPMDTGAGMGHS